MPQVNLSTLSGPKLRRLLDGARERGEAALSYQILQEMAARREGRAPRGLFPMRRPAAPRIVAMDLGHPAEPGDDLPPPEPKRPRSVWDDDPPPPVDEAAGSKSSRLRLRPPRLPSLRAVRPLRRGPAAGFAVGAAVGVALGWWAGGIGREPPSPPAAPAAAPVRTAALAPRPAPAPAPAAPTVAEFAPETPPVPAAGPPPDLREGPVLSPDAAEVARDAAAEAMELPAEADACAAEPTPADRRICGDPDLRRLQGELRQAYAEALEAHADRALLRQRQLAWASARDTVSEPDRLARLYEERIRRLNAATAAARQQR